jgi:hypothetical protein
MKILYTEWNWQLMKINFNAENYNENLKILKFESGLIILDQL